MAEITSIPIDPGDYYLPPYAPGFLPDLSAENQRTEKFHPVYEIQTFYVGDMGLVQLPTAGALGSLARVVRTHAPSAQKLVWWKAWRFIDKPILPHFDSGNPNEVLASFLIVPSGPMLLPGAQNFIFACEGAYAYHLTQTPCLTDDFYTGTMPLFNATTEDLKLQGWEFSRDLLRTRPPATYTGTADQDFRTVDTTATLITPGGFFPGP